MPRRLKISLRQRDEVFKHYARGATPTEIIVAHPEFGLTAKQIRTMALKGHWAQRRNEIAEIKKQSAAQVLAEVREQATDEFRTFLDVHGESIEEDSERLKTGWNLVANAADASSLMRAKKLHFERGIEHYLGGPSSFAPSFASAIANVFVASAPVQRLSVPEKAERSMDSADREQGESEESPRSNESEK